MARKNRRHVTPRPDGTWAVQAPGSKRASSVHRTQKEAEAVAKDLVRKADGGEVRIHGLDGKIRDSDTVPPANDPNPPKDTKH